MNSKRKNLAALGLALSISVSAFASEQSIQHRELTVSMGHIMGLVGLSKDNIETIQFGLTNYFDPSSQQVAALLNEKKEKLDELISISKKRQAIQNEILKQNELAQLELSLLNEIEENRKQLKTSGEVTRNEFEAKRQEIEARKRELIEKRAHAGHFARIPFVGDARLRKGVKGAKYGIPAVGTLLMGNSWVVDVVGTCANATQNVSQILKCSTSVLNTNLIVPTLCLAGATASCHYLSSLADKIEKIENDELEQDSLMTGIQKNKSEAEANLAIEEKNLDTQFASSTQTLESVTCKSNDLNCLQTELDSMIQESNLRLLEENQKNILEQIKIFKGMDQSEGIRQAGFYSMSTLLNNFLLAVPNLSADRFLIDQGTESDKVLEIDL